VTGLSPSAAAGRAVLVIDDEEVMRDVLQTLLQRSGYAVHTAAGGADGLALARSRPFDAVIVDVMMPDMEGFETLRMIREESTVPVIMLTARAEEEDKIKGLNLGADDYVTKPFSPRELATRVKAVVRRAELPSQVEKAPIRVDDRLQVDFNRREVIVDGSAVKLRPTEWRLLYHLMQNAGWVVPHETLLAKVWGWEYRDETQYLRLYITYLRQKIEKDLNHPQYIFTERGSGYRFVDYKKNRLT